MHLSMRCSVLCHPFPASLSIFVLPCVVPVYVRGKPRLRPWGSLIYTFCRTMAMMARVRLQRYSSASIAVMFEGLGMYDKALEWANVLTDKSHNLQGRYKTTIDSNPSAPSSGSIRADVAVFCLPALVRAYACTFTFTRPARDGRAALRSQQEVLSPLPCVPLLPWSGDGKARQQ